jgi:hypothetical protein
MSSKRRRAARAWMTAERQRSDGRADVAARNAERRVDQDWKARLSRIIPPHDSATFYPQGRLDRPYLQVLAPERMEFAATFDPTDAYAREQMLGSRLSVVEIHAEQMAMVLPNGAKVIWWTWRMGR